MARRPLSTYRKVPNYRLRRIVVGIGAIAVVVAIVLGVSSAFGGGGGRGGGGGATAGSGGPATTAPSKAAAGSQAHPPPDKTSIGRSGVTAQWVKKENAKPGTKAWRITRPSTGVQIDGYANTVSIDSGGTVALYVSTTAASYHIEAFRMGYYGGNEGRLVWSSRSVAGVSQPACPVTVAVEMVQCHWTKPVTVATSAATWPQGDYLFKLTSAAGWQSYIPLTIRDDASHSAYLVNNDVTTWQAYNNYGGYDLYLGPTGSGGTSFANRAYIVSFDRPYEPSLGNGDGAADFLGLELKMVAMMESRGLDVSYTTDVNVNENPALLEHHHCFVSLGHDEYYSLVMRNGVQQARNHGVNLIFLGANAIYRHIRFQASPLGPDRQEIDYKDPSKDPLLGKDNADVTPYAWRDPPNNNPESAILGEMWACNPVRGDMVITDPHNWMFSGTGLTAGSHIAGIVGPEFDHYTPGAPAPNDVTVLARSPVNCNGVNDEADMTYYTAPSGAGVWDTGTIDWVGSVHPYCATCAAPDAATKITANVLAAFGPRPAGRVHPSAANDPLSKG